MDQEVPKKRGPTPFPEPIARVSLHDELVARLRDMVIEGEIAPGSRVPERELCQRFHVSRTPLREALKVLAADGLIQLAPNRGARVAELTEADVEEMFPVMGALEALAGELAASRITEEGLAEVRALHYQMVLHHKRGELAPYFRLNQQIHEKILEAAGNPTLVALYRGLAGRIRRARYLANMSAQRWARAVEEHEAILAALEARDGPRLGALLKDHLKNKCETVKEALQSENGEGGQAASNS
jgi:DNA-binding GntR family transcriptional regulator